MTKVIIHGSRGRMGQMLIACGEKMDGLDIVIGVDEGDSLADHIANCDAVIDFSLHNATAACAALSPPFSSTHSSIADSKVRKS